MNQSYCVHAELKPETVWVFEDVFYNLEGVSQEWKKCQVFGLTCLEGCVPTFEILTPDGYVFSEVPPHLIRTKPFEKNTENLLLDELVYNNCLSNDFVISQFSKLSQTQAHVFIRNKNEYIKGQYWFSLDFYKNNNWFHCMKLDQGQIAFIPSHKIIFGSISDEHQFPKYKKLRHSFKV